jgi:hypothetical protein
VETNATAANQILSPHSSTSQKSLVKSHPIHGNLKKIEKFNKLLLMNYLVAVLADRIQAEAAYTALEAANLDTSKIAILGKGYQSADEYGLIDPRDGARKQVKLMATWLVPFGAFGGVTFTRMTGLDTFAYAGDVSNYAIGGLVGALSGLLGSVFVGGGTGLLLGGGDAIPYRNRLNAGKYLIVVKGNDLLIRKSTQILREFNPENLQGYVDPSGT